MFEVVDYISLRKLLALISMPDGFELACDKVIAHKRMMMTGALIYNSKSDSYALIDEYGMKRVGKTGARDFMAKLAA